MDTHILQRAYSVTSKRATHYVDKIEALCLDCGPHYNLVYTVKEMSKIKVRREIVRILHENKQLFEEGLGKCISTNAKLEFKADPVPKFFRARPVPIALRPKVGVKLEELLRTGTLRRVEHSQWATPLVIVPKPGEGGGDKNLWRLQGHGKSTTRYKSVPSTATTRPVPYIEWW
ncbi:hypothetical protein ANCCAN_04268 [Ancylostoma caninum]|uniref:Reverse transcriptase domain-containing protein n=1 Tax=Ancylostoma caninum TaxID=29170 RepID=A0A368GZ84_ANCCA|nr:hypothetical protein ANCCAN_04268 [Ancylostoma caninum]